MTSAQQAHDWMAVSDNRRPFFEEFSYLNERPLTCGLVLGIFKRFHKSGITSVL